MCLCLSYFPVPTALFHWASNVFLILCSKLSLSFRGKFKRILSMFYQHSGSAARSGVVPKEEDYFIRSSF